MCPRCKTPASKSSPESETRTVATAETEAQESIEAAAVTGTADGASGIAAPATSTLIEFPGVSRVSRPQWRKELSERVREIQERRARESVREPEEVQLKEPERPMVLETAAPQLGLVPQPDAPAVNPIVIAALKRLERARQSMPPVPRPRAGRGGAAAAAAARVAAEQYEAETMPVNAQPAVTAQAVLTAQPAQAESLPQPKAPEPQRERPLVAVPAPSAPKVAASAAAAAEAAAPAGKPKPAKVAAEKIEVPAPEPLPEEAGDDPSVADFYDDRAPLLSRLTGSLIDLLVVAFASSPFAAIIELTNGNWSDWRVMASMGGIVLIVMFLYLTAATALAGRTWGMSLFSLRAVDADSGLSPTTKQAVGRAILYILSLATLGLGLLYALFDVEGRTVHDHLSGTVVVRD